MGTIVDIRGKGKIYYKSDIWIANAECYLWTTKDEYSMKACSGILLITKGKLYFPENNYLTLHLDNGMKFGFSWESQNPNLKRWEIYWNPI